MYLRSLTRGFYAVARVSAKGAARPRSRMTFAVGRPAIPASLALGVASGARQAGDGDDKGPVNFHLSVATRKVRLWRTLPLFFPFYHASTCPWRLTKSPALPNERATKISEAVYCCDAKMVIRAETDRLSDGTRVSMLDLDGEPPKTNSFGRGRQECRLEARILSHRERLR